jgi:3-oxoacyl-[acyl-carrier-protein] synthase-1
MSSDDIVIAGVGMATSVGLTAKETYYSVKAGVSNFRESHILDKNRRPVVMASIPSHCLVTDPEIVKTNDPSISRLLGLFHLACEDFSNNASELLMSEPYPLYIGVPERLLEKNRLALLPHVSESVGIRNTIVRAFSEGRASSLIALHEATEDIIAGKVEAAYVAGCDSYVDLKILSDLDRASRLKSDENLNGFIPGEGAALLFLTKESIAKDLCLSTMTHLISSARGFEEGHMGSDQPYRGDGLSNCMSYLRHTEKFQQAFAMHHPADCFGDTGAASGIVILGYCHFFSSDDSEQHVSLTYASSDQGSSCIFLTC